MDRSPCHGSVTAQTKYWGKFVPLLGLVEDLDSEFRIYVLECESQAFGSPSTWYVGVEHRSQIARRVQTQFAQTPSAAHFCRVNKPKRIEVIWPARDRAAEAFVFYALVGKLPARALASGRLGGWTQTHTDVNQLGRVHLERERRMVTNSCLGCGKKGHFDRDCPASSSDNFMVYNCGHCNAAVRISDQGKQTTQTTRGTKRLHDDVASLPPVNPAAPSARLRPQVPQAAGVQQVAAAPQQRRPAYLRVLVCGHEYTSLQWFLGKKPTPRKVAEVLAKCKGHAVQLRFGDTKTLEAAGFAKSSPHGKELLPGRQNLPRDWQDTACRAVRGSTKVQLRRPGAPSAARGILWRVSDLQRVRT